LIARSLAGAALTLTLTTPAFAQASFNDAINLTAFSGQHDVGSTGVAVGDINGDGIADLVTVSPSVFSAAILYGAPGGTFGAPVTVQLTRPGQSVAVGDIDGDGRLDIVVTEPAHGVEILYNSPLGGFVPASAGGGAGLGVVNVIDLNGDGRLDIVALSTTTSRILTIFQISRGEFEERSISTNGVPTALAIVDMNHDGFADFLVATSTGFQVFYLTHQGVLDVTQMNVAGGFTAIAAADVDGDGNMDVVGAQSGTGVVTKVTIVTGTNNAPWFSNGPYASFGSRYTTTSIIVTDLDGDGFVDLITANETLDKSNGTLAGNTVYVIPGGLGPVNHGVQSFAFLTAAATVLAVGTSPHEVVMADVNGDSLPDLVTANSLQLDPHGNAANVSVLIRQATSADLQRLLATITSLQQHVADLIGQLSTAQAHGADVESQLSSAQSQILSLQNQLATATSTIQALNAQVDALTADRAALASSNATLSTQNATLTTQNSTLTSSNQLLTTRVTSLQAQLDAALAEKAALQAQASSLTAANQQLTQENATLTTANQQLALQNTGMTASIQALQTQLAQSTAALQAQTASLQAMIAALTAILRDAFKDPQFVIPGATPIEQWQTVVRALDGLDKKGMKNLREFFHGGKHSDR
jgi:hypothetical protein